MADLKEFLLRDTINEAVHEFYPSPRFEAEGLSFKVRSLTGAQLDELRKKSRKNKKIDATLLSRNVVIDGTVEPNFRDAEFIAQAGCRMPEEVLSKVLLPGEIDNIARAIMQASGYDDDFEVIIKKAKNS